MILALLINLFLLIIVPAPKGTTPQNKQTTIRTEEHHKAEELCELTKAYWYTDPRQSVTYGKEAIKAAYKLNDNYLLAKAYNNTGAGFYVLGDYSTAAEHFYKAIKLREILGDTSGLSSCYNNIGNIYNSQENYPKALVYYNKSLRLANIVQDTLAISRALNNLGNVYERQMKYKTALQFYKKALPLKEKLQDEKGTIISLVNIGNTYQKQGKYKLALVSLERGLSLSLKAYNPYELIYAYRGLAETYLGLKEYEKAINYGQKSLNIAQQTHSKAEAKTSAEVVHKIYSETGNYERAYHYLKLFTAYTDSLNTEEITRQTTSFQVKYETAQKEKENLKLLAEHELHEQEINHKSIIQYTTIGFLALAVTVVILIYRGNRRTKRMNKMLSRKNKKVSRYSENIKQQKNELGLRAKKLIQQKEELEKLNQLKDKLFSIVAHDLRGPLLSLKSLLQVLAMGKITEEQFLYFARTLETEQQNTLWLVDNLLLWAKSQMQGTNVKPEEISVHALAEDTVKLLTPQADRKGIHLHNLAHQELKAFADADMIQLVLRNLISNAIKFCNNGDIVTIETELTAEGELQVAVRDTGLGIPVDKQEKLFGLRSYTTLGTAKERGSGLGLAMCKDFVESDSGNIWVESTFGEGSTFKFTLPLANKTIAASPAQQASVAV